MSKINTILPDDITNMQIITILERYPFVQEFLDDLSLDISGCNGLSIIEFLDKLSDEELFDKALDRKTFPKLLKQYIEGMEEFLGIKNETKIASLTILAGQNKEGKPETFSKLTLYTSQIIAVVGATGSGKSRLLADIEWTARKDTPTGRSILINDKEPDLSWRYSANKKLVAQLSQNMNFIMDLNVEEFLRLHAESRMIEDIDEVVNKIFREALNLSGEKFDMSTPITSLSGGQSRALMIADTAILSSSPIILIDEIENAGIDRNKALELLIAEDKIVLIATHDPLLALAADKRIVIKNGGIEKILITTDREKELLEELTKTDEMLKNIRQELRLGMQLENII